MSVTRAHLLGLIAILVLAGCTTVETTPYPTYTPCPTYTPYPTYTPHPSCTLIPFEEEFEKEFDRRAEEWMDEFTEGLVGLFVEVKSGDTLANIAKKYGANLDDIVSINELGDPSHIYPGQLLVLPLVPRGGEDESPPPTPMSCWGGCTEHISGCDIKGNISVETGEKIYHVPGGQYYEATIIRPEYGERWFCTEEEAIAAGWRRSKR